MVMQIKLIAVVIVVVVVVVVVVGALANRKYEELSYPKNATPF